VNVFRCCAHIGELEHAYFSCGDNQLSLPDLHPEAVRPLPTTLSSDPHDLECSEYVLLLLILLLLMFVFIISNVNTGSLQEFM